MNPKGLVLANDNSKVGPTEEPAVDPIRSLLRDSNFLVVWLVGGLTGIVRWLQLLVLGIYTFEITGSALLVSVVPMLWMIPLALGGPILGVLADQANRKLLLLFALAGIITVSIWMSVLASIGDPSFGHIAIVSLLSGFFWATDMPVRRRLLGDLSGTHLASAMSLDSATGNATRMAGPLLGGIVLEFFSFAGVFFFSCAVFMLCLALIVFTRAPQRRTGAPASFLRELSGGISFVLRSPRLRTIFAITIVFNVWGFPFTSMIPIIGSNTLSLSPLLVGVLSSAEGLGALIGALTIALVAKPKGFFWIYVGGTTTYLVLVGYLSILTYVAGGPSHSFYACTVALIGIGISGSCFAAMQGTLTYMEADPAYRSRVLGVLTLCIGMGPIGFFNIGWMAETMGVSAALAISSLQGLSALALLLLFSAQLPTPQSTSETPMTDSQ